MRRDVQHHDDFQPWKHKTLLTQNISINEYMETCLHDDGALQQGMA
jgi:hypothetical protein